MSHAMLAIHHMTGFLNMKTVLKSKFDLLRKNNFFLWNIFGNIGPLLIAIFCVPNLYRYQPSEYFGYLTIIWAIIGYAGIFDFGLARAITYYAAVSKKSKNISFSKSLLKSILISILISATFIASSKIFENEIINILNLKNPEEKNAIFILIFSIPIYLISNLFRASLEGLEGFREANIFKFISYSSLFLCPTFLLMVDDSSLAHVCIFYSLVRTATAVYAFLKLSPFIRISLAQDQIAAPLRDLLSFGGWTTISSTISPLMVYGDRVVLASMAGVSSIGVYAILQEFIGKTILISASYVASIQPRMSYTPEQEARSIYTVERLNIIYFSVVVYLCCLLISPFFVAVWLGISAREVALLSTVMSIGFLFNSIAQTPHAFLLARGQPHRIAYSHVVEAVLYFPLLIVATMHYGVLGAACAGTARMIFDFGILSWQARRPIA